MSKILEVKNLKKHFPIRRGIFRKVVGQIKAVDDITFSIEQGKMVALVGESGSGKSTAGLSAISLVEPTSGDVFFMGKNLKEFSKQEKLLFRQKVQIIFQDPLSSLSPRKTVLDNIGEALLYHGFVKNREEQTESVLQILKKIGLREDALLKYPHQFSGGQQQRISIGRALAMNPKLIVCDESVSALDVSIQAQILNLLHDLKEEFNLSYLFITHDLGVVRTVCDSVLVMYKGKIVERGSTEEVFANPRHPYTQMLLASIPKSHPRMQRAKLLQANEKRNQTSDGCAFYPRCSQAKEACQHHAPPQKGEGHSYSCIH